LRNEVHAEYHTDVIALFTVYSPASQGIVPQYDPYKAAYDDEIAALDIILKSEFTDEIKEYDLVRDKTFRGFSDAVKAFTNHFNKEKREAGERVNNILAHYGNIAAHTIDAETAAIDDLLRELRLDGHVQDVTALGLTEWVDQLEIENNEFKTLMYNRYNELAARTALRMKTTRKATDSAFRHLLNQLDALVLVNGETDYIAFITALNVISERYKNILAQQAGMRAKQKPVEN
jgi:murein L,D-transpeptidase YcbB/YkuD